MTTSTFSFTNTRGNNPNAGTVANPTGVRPVTPSQIKYYMDLCVQRKVSPKNYLLMDYDTMHMEIETLKKFYPASQKQIDMIKEKVTNLNNMGITIIMPSDSELSALSGGLGGTASIMIASLIEKENENSDKMPPTDNQLQFIVSMYLCPDVPFENFGILRRMPLEGQPEGSLLWRRPTPDEFAGFVHASMNKQQASKFIDDYRGILHTWKQTRIRPEQMKYIQQLEERMSDTSSPTVVEYAIVDNKITQIVKTVEKVAKYNPTGYTPLDEMQLMMMSVEDASKYIDILKSELANKALTSYGEISDSSETFEFLRMEKDAKEKKANEFAELQNLIFKLEAVAGYSNQEVHDAVTYFLVIDDVDPEMVANNRKVIRDFIMFLLDEEYISFESMTELVKDSPVAQMIMLGK